MHGPDVALIGGAAIPDFRPLPIRFDADAALEIRRQAELRRWQSARGGPLVQGKGALVVLRHALAFGEAGGDLELRERVAVGSGLAQLRCSDGRVQLGQPRTGAVLPRLEVAAALVGEERPQAADEGEQPGAGLVRVRAGPTASA